MYVINRFNAHGAMAGDQFTEYTNQKQVINSNEMHNYYDIHKCKLSNKLQIHILHTSKIQNNNSAVDDDYVS
jgi:hypothetical protein